MKTAIQRMLLAAAAGAVLSACAGPRYWSSDDALAYDYVCRPGHAIKYRVDSTANWPAAKVWDGGSCARY